MLGREVHGKTLGIIGMGRIGHQVARRAIGFDMTVLYHNRHRREDVERALAPSVRFAEKDDLLARSDYVMLCVPLTDQTRGCIGTRELSLMKPDATLINIARGAVVDTEALARSPGRRPHRRRGPRRDRARAAAPRPPLLAMPNVIITPTWAAPPSRPAAAWPSSPSRTSWPASAASRCRIRSAAEPRIVRARSRVRSRLPFTVGHWRVVGRTSRFGPR